MEVTRQTDLSMGNMDQLMVLEAKANLKKTWEDLLSQADVPNIYDRDKRLKQRDFYDPNHPVTILILYICQIQCFVLPEINRAIQTQDESKVETLGPFDYALSKTIV